MHAVAQRRRARMDVHAHTRTRTHARAQTRLHSGVHFQPAIDAAVELCKPMGVSCYDRMVQLRDGSA